MARLSVLTFTCNDEELAKGLIKDVGSFADDIVVMDSSDRPIRASAMPFSSKVRVFHSKRLGYPEPFKAYGISKCTGDWILIIYTDERVSGKLKKEIKKLIAVEKRSLVMSIKRYEDWKGRPRNYYSWQNVLFRNKIGGLNGMKGNIHEIIMPKKGKVKMVDDPECYMMHFSKDESFRLEYSALNQMLRISYRELPRKLRSAGGVFDSKVSNALLNMYIGNRDLGGELSNTDYAMYFLLFHIRYLMQNKDIRTLTKVFPQRIAEIKSYKADRDGELLFKAIKEADSVGITYYLGLDNERGMRRIERYKEAGPKLLFRLILEEYARRHRIK